MMGFLKRLSGGNTGLELIDSELGKFDNNYFMVEHITWIGSAVLFGNSIELLMDGNPETLSQNQKQIVLNALASEDLLKSESYIAISKEYGNADMKLTSLDEQLMVKAITSNENEFESLIQFKNAA